MIKADTIELAKKLANSSSVAKALLDTLEELRKANALLDEAFPLVCPECGADVENPQV